MDDIGPRMTGKRITCDVRFMVVALEGHHFAVSVLLRNLLANALLYSPVGGRIAVQSEALADTVVLSVDDSGPGIAPHDRERAFERFNRLGQTKTEGVGLGLAIVLSVVELHRARIELLDSPLGGLRVQVTFRAAMRVQSARPEPAPALG